MINFSSGKARLDWLLWEIGLRLEAIDASLETYNDLEPLIACTSLLRLAYNHGRAVNVLLHEGLSESVAPLERAIYEIWTDFRHLLDADARPEAARCMMINAAMETGRFAFQQRHSFLPEEVRLCFKALRSYRDDYPSTYEKVWLQRRAGKFHWSGLSRSALMRKVAKDRYNIYYKGLSWDSHAELASIGGIKITPDAEGAYTIDFEPMYDLSKLSELQAYAVGGMLYTFWNEYAYIFKQDSVIEMREDGA
jgi:hypothetical protein